MKDIDGYRHCDRCGAILTRENNKCGYEICDKCNEYLDDLGKNKPKTGHWILLDECANSGYYCSECHKKVVKEGWSDTVKKIKYCPNCGAKMESEDQK